MITAMLHTQTQHRSSHNRGFSALDKTRTGYDGLSAAYDAQDDDTVHNPYLKSSVQTRSVSTKQTRYGWLVLILLLLNVIWALIFTVKGSAWEGGNETPLLPSIAAEHIKLTTLFAPLAATGVTSGNLATTPALATSATNTNACYTWEFSSDADVKRASTTLNNYGWTAVTSELATVPITYMVFMGPFSNRAEAEIQAKKLDVLKLSDYTFLPGNDISLSVVDTPEAAANFKAKLTARGLSDVKTRERHSTKQRLRYRFEAVDPQRQPTLIQLTRNFGSLYRCTAT
jgi:hypothetical protein